MPELTLLLLTARFKKVLCLLDSIDPGAKHMFAMKWCRLLGNLRSIVPAIPSRIGLFSHLQAALLHVASGQRRRVKLTTLIHEELRNCHILLFDLWQ